jgi:hydrogenase nickel incorporation protein HypB
MKEIPVVKNILKVNESIAQENRERFDKVGVRVVNMMSGPGAGKTTLLSESGRILAERGVRLGVIVGDVDTTLDAERLVEAGVMALQVNTGNRFGGACHLDANMVSHALGTFRLDEVDVLAIENVGNLVCPASYVLGEHASCALVSITEGPDKPVKYPKMFRVIDAAVISKTDLAPHLDVSTEDLSESVRQVNAELPIFPLSAKTGEGMEAWVEWLAGEKA